MEKYKQLVKNLNLIPHKEGGLFAETHRDQNSFASHIYYILKKNEISKWHKLKKNEILNFYDGDPLVVYLYNSTNDKKVNKIVLGRNIENNKEFYHYTVKKNTWFSMETLGSWSLIGCVVAPAFEYSDLEIAPLNWSPGKK